LKYLRNTKQNLIQDGNWIGRNMNRIALNREQKPCLLCNIADWQFSNKPLFTKIINTLIVCRCLLFVTGTDGGLVLFYELQSTSRDEAIWAENTSLSTSLPNIKQLRRTRNACLSLFRFIFRGVYFLVLYHNAFYLKNWGGVGRNWLLYVQAIWKWNLITCNWNLRFSQRRLWKLPWRDVTPCSLVEINWTFRSRHHLHWQQSAHTHYSRHPIHCIYFILVTVFRPAAKERQFG